MINETAVDDPKKNKKMPHKILTDGSVGQTEQGLDKGRNYSPRHRPVHPLPSGRQAPLASTSPRGEGRLGLCRSSRGDGGDHIHQLLYRFDKRPRSPGLSVEGMPSVLAGPAATDEEGDVARNHSFP